MAEEETSDDSLKNELARLREALARLPEDLVLPRHPGQLFDYDVLSRAIDGINGLWTERFGRPLFRFIRTDPLSQFAKACSSEDELRSRLGALSDLIGAMRIDKNKYRGNLLPEDCKPIDLLERFLEAEAPDFEQKRQIVDTLRNICRVRNLFIHGAKKGNIQALLSFGDFYPLRQGQEQALWDKVRASFLECLKLLKEAIAPDKGFYSLMMEARLAAEKEEWQTSRELYERAIRLDPDDADAHFGLGYVYWGLGRNEEAIEAYIKTIWRSPDIVEAYDNLKIISEDLSNKVFAFERNIPEVRRLVENPDDPAAYYCLGRMCEWTEDKSEALQIYKKVIDLEPDNADAYFRMGLLCLDLGRYEEAIKAAKEAIRLRPDGAAGPSLLAAGYYALGNEYAGSGRFEEANKQWDFGHEQSQIAREKGFKSPEKHLREIGEEVIKQMEKCAELLPEEKEEI